MKESFDRKIGQPKNPESIAPKLKTAPKSSYSLIGPITVGIATAVCVVVSGGKEANAEPVIWKIGMPFGDDVNGDTETTFRGITPGEKPNRFRLTYTRAPTDISANEYVYDKWIEIDDGPDNAVVVRELGTAEFTTEYPNPQYGYYGHPENNLEYCIDGVTYKIEGFPASLQQEKNGILVNGQPVWNPYPYPDGLDPWTTIDEVTRSADPTKLKINASPFIPNGDWENNPWYYSTWKVDIVAELNCYDAIQKAIDKAWAEGKDPFEAGLTNSLDGGNAKGGLIMSPETERLIAMTRTGYNDINYSSEYTYFFLRDAITNQYMPLKRNSGGVWSLEDNINDGFGEADFIYGISCDTENTPVGALSRETPQGGKEHIFIIEHCGTVGTLILKEQPDNSFTEPTLIHEEDTNVDVSGENILCVNSNPIPEADKGPEQVEVSTTVEQPIVAEEPAVAEIPTAVEQPVVVEEPVAVAEISNAVEQPNTAETIIPTTADEGGGTLAEQPTTAEIPNIAEQPVVAEFVPDAVSGPEADAGSSAEEGGEEIIILPPPADISVTEETEGAEQNPDGVSADASETSIEPESKTDGDSAEETAGYDIIIGENGIEVGDIEGQMPELHDASGSPDEPIVPKSDTVINGKDALQGGDASVAQDTIQPSQEKDDSEKSGGGNCNTVNDSRNSAPITSISALILALASRLRRKPLPTTDR